MARWLGILLAIGLAGTSADAQVFKPKTKKTTSSEKKSSSSEKKSSSSEKTEKKSARTSPSKKRVTTKPKKKHGDDDASDAPKESDKDFVQITDDDDIE